MVDLDKTDSSKSENLIVQPINCISGRKKSKSKSPQKFISSLNVKLNFQKNEANSTPQFQKTVSEAKNLPKQNNPEEKILNSKKTTASQTAESPKQNLNNKPKKFVNFTLKKDVILEIAALIFIRTLIKPETLTVQFHPNFSNKDIQLE